jgi:sigma-B regulation protein RsbU (phosphoserine phosphatase)
MDMAASPKPFVPEPQYESAQAVRDLLRLQNATQRISSTLDLEQLLEGAVHDVMSSFGALESSIWLVDGEHLVLAGIRGCTVYERDKRLRIATEGMVGWAARHGRTRYAPDVSQDPYFIGCEPEIRSEVAIPLRADGQIIGVFSASHRELDGFSPWQLQLFENLAEQLGIAVANARRFGRERRERELLRREADEARVIQQALLPNASPFFPGFAVQGHTLPAGAVGGDWYDYIPLSDGKWGIVLADVAGKGMSAALLMSGTRAALRAIADTCLGPSHTLARLNRQLLADMPAARYVTMIYAVFDPAERKVTLANAGHPWPLFAAGGEVRPLKTDRGLPLGITEGVYSTVEVELTPGSRLLLYSDGVSEAADDSDNEYGWRDLACHLVHPDVSAERLLLEAQRFTGGQPLVDDATVILLRAEEQH